jgi:NAD(P)-dependent dehydrogenase (short-subunit alcohol dehydrogenase family)
MTILRRKALITGAAGGMGRACARLFGSTHDLVLTDAVAEPLERFSDDLRAEGFTVLATHAGDLGNAALLSTLVADATGDVPLTLIHTAGLSPSQADASAIMAVNLVATVKLLDAIEPILTSGSVAVVIASTAGHMMPVIPEIAPLFADPLAPGFLDNVCGAIEAMSGGAPAGAPGFSYALSKQAVIALVEKRAAAWGQHGARIVSISPGLILTPMGRKELAETQGAAQTADAAPVGRSGIAMDIALAARFLASDEASFVSGCDLRVDGGSTAVLKTLMGG